MFDDSVYQANPKESQGMWYTVAYISGRAFFRWLRRQNVVSAHRDFSCMSLLVDTLTQHRTVTPSRLLLSGRPSSFCSRPFPLLLGRKNFKLCIQLIASGVCLERKLATPLSTPNGRTSPTPSPERVYGRTWTRCCHSQEWVTPVEQTR
ncbi:hypothetical protein K523DRAFT_146706 [Schizophyllum commune Tattone D]|nr:hypothetical protein K523DRAFT_146706 [Schizophyllum commune Tattone D]